MRILSAEEMREVDHLTTERYDVPSLSLMENAGSAVASYCLQRVESIASARFLAICGKGNNGGDGLVAARQLVDRGAFVHVIILASYEEVRRDAKVNLDAFMATGVRPHFVTTLKEWQELLAAMPTPDLVIDAILGTGLTKPVEGFLAQVIEDVNSLFPALNVLSVDLPSGLNADSHQILGPAIHAGTTITMTAPKIALAFPPAAELTGDVRIASIGSPESLIEENTKQNLYWLTLDDCRYVAHPRPLNSNKGAFGHVLIIAGSVGKTGAASMAGRAALRAGAGLVTVATAGSALSSIAQAMPELMTIPLPETAAGSLDVKAFDYGTLDEAVRGKTILALGPGLSTHPETQELARRVVSGYSLPMVIDADGLNAFVDHAEELNGQNRVLILTPHPGELARLIRTTPQIIQSDRKNFAREFAARHHVILVLKGFRSLIATPDGRIFVCPTGNPGMAKGGSGDVLTGIIAALLAQYPQIPPEQSVSTAVYLHGLAGDFARTRCGEVSMIASDLIESLPDVFKFCVSTPTSYQE